jgi:hypothetical protein
MAPKSQGPRGGYLLAPNNLTGDVPGVLQPSGVVVW